MDPQYLIENGILYFVDSHGDRRAMPENAVAIFFDAEDGTLLKHGTPSAVTTYSETVRAAFAKVFDASLLTLMTFAAANINQAVVEEINKCLSISGYAKRLEGALRQFAA